MKFRFVILSMIFIIFAGCVGKTAQDDDNNLIQIVASFYPLAEFSRQVGGEYVEVMQLVPPGAEVHSYEPTPRDIEALYEADIVVLNGAGQEPWADENLVNELKNNGVVVLVTAEHFDGVLHEGHEHEGEGDQDEHDEEDHEEEEDDNHAHELDPHIWLDPLLAMSQMTLIEIVLSTVDGEHAVEYTENGNVYRHELQTLHENFVARLARCEHDTIITSHEAFGYMAGRYSFEQLGIRGLSSDVEPSPRRLADLADTAEMLGLTAIFFETNVDPVVSETLAREIGAETLVLNPIESLTNEEVLAGENYVSIMEQNLENLVKGLQCDTGMSG